MRTSDPSYDLIHRATRGDDDAVRALFTDLRSTMRGFVLSILGSGYQESVEDIVQDVLLKVYRTLDRFDPARGVKFKTWVLTYCRNHCYDLLKKRRVPTRSLEAFLDDGKTVSDAFADSRAVDPAQAASNLELGADLQRAVRALEGIHRQIYELRVVRNLDYDEISRRAGVEIGTAKSRMHRTKKILRKLLADWGPPPNLLATQVG